MTLQRRLVAVMALMLVIGLLVADIVTYASVRSFLYGRADSTITQDESVAFNYLTFADEQNEVVTNQSLSRRISSDVYLLVVDHSGHVILRRPSGSINDPDPSPVLTKDIPVQHVPNLESREDSGRYAGPFHPSSAAVDLGSMGDPDGTYRAIAVTVPQGTLITALSLNPTKDTLGSLRRVEIIASVLVLLAMTAIASVVVRRGLRPLRQMTGTADAIASGDLTRRVPEERPGTEVGQLGIALNKMLAQIEGAFGEKSASEERLRQFVADASHELRTPLTSIRGYAELLGRGGFSDEAGRNKALKRIEEEATRMGGLVEDLLLLAELDRGRPLRAEPVDLHRICADAVDDSMTVAQSHHLTLTPGNPVVVLGDDERLAQVAHNLVRNALAHTPAGTSITVSTGASGGMGFIRVADNGPGISPEESARVFDRFYQGDPSRSGGGTGLGLAIVLAIAEASGGSAELVSPALVATPGGGSSTSSPSGGPGTTVVVRIPLAVYGRRAPAGASSVINDGNGAGNGSGNGNGAANGAGSANGGASGTAAEAAGGPAMPPGSSPAAPGSAQRH
jgi:two-component system OmpR family sensor kinase